MTKNETTIEFVAFGLVAVCGGVMALLGHFYFQLIDPAQLPLWQKLITCPTLVGLYLSDNDALKGGVVAALIWCLLEAILIWFVVSLCKDKKHDDVRV